MDLKKKIKLAVFLTLLTGGFSACSAAKDDLTPGIWRATIKNEAGTEVPFNFEVIDSAEKKIIYILNADDRLKVDEVYFSNDSLTIKLPLFDSELKTGFTNKGLSGRWIRHLADKDVSMPFNAERNKSYRFFETTAESSDNIAGRWSTLFISADKKDTTVAVGEFKQNRSRVTGTFLTSTGDYRFLEGAISKGKIFLSAFDGSNCMLFTGTIDGNNILDGKLYSGLSTVRDWSARKDENAILPDAYTLTSLKPGYTTVSFSFPDLKGKQVSLQDPAYKDKVVIIQFLGTWCPNCMDETAYMTEFYKRYKEKGVEVIGLAYERTSDPVRSKNSVEQLRKRFDVTYPLLLTGFTSREALKSMPALNAFKAFPTTILIDRKGNVNKIHTGFSGPGTGTHYTEYIRDFEAQVNRLLSDK